MHKKISCTYILPNIREDYRFVFLTITDEQEELHFKTAGGPMSISVVINRTWPALPVRVSWHWDVVDPALVQEQLLRNDDRESIHTADTCSSSSAKKLQEKNQCNITVRFYFKHTYIVQNLKTFIRTIVVTWVCVLKIQEYCVLI